MPGGGPFADTVREVDRRLHISDDAAHWMAVLAMDQYAHILVSRLGGGILVAIDRKSRQRSRDQQKRFRFSRPIAGCAKRSAAHSWTVTSDSIAAWVAGQVAHGNSCL